MATKQAEYRTFPVAEAAECFKGCGYLDTERTLQPSGFPVGQWKARCPECGMQTWFDVKAKD